MKAVRASRLWRKRAGLHLPGGFVSSVDGLRRHGHIVVAGHAFAQGHFLYMILPLICHRSRRGSLYTRRLDGRKFLAQHPAAAAFYSRRHGATGVLRAAGGPSWRRRPCHRAERQHAAATGPTLNSPSSPAPLAQVQPAAQPPWLEPPAPPAHHRTENRPPWRSSGVASWRRALGARGRARHDLAVVNAGGWRNREEAWRWLGLARWRDCL